MKQANRITLFMAVAGLVAMLAACAHGPKMPAMDGVVVELRRSDRDLSRGDFSYDSTLQLYWFGSGCHLIQLGDARVLTDPFVTNELKLIALRSKPERVEATLGMIPAPDAVLVSHSHHDHILDAHAAMSQDPWRAGGVPLYGGMSCKNLLAGWKDAEVDNRCHVVPKQGGVLLERTTPKGYSIRITAYRTKHSPHCKCGFTLADGMIRSPRQSIPNDILDFQAGEVYNYLVELSRGRVSFNVMCLGNPYDLVEVPDCMPPVGTRIDVAIMLAPTADNVRGYPEEHLARLKPRHVVLSHFNTFVREDPDEQLAILGIDFVKMPQLTRDMQATFARTEREYSEFEKMHIPAITVFEENGGARNVIRIP